MKNVLLIDDSRSIHAWMRTTLLAHQLQLHSAYNGRDGLRMAAELIPDVILLDVEMPDLDGYEVCRRLKQNADLKLIPVIFLTGLASPEQKVKGLDLGAIDYVSKVSDVGELLARVRVSLRLKYLMDLLATTARLDALTGLWNRVYLNERITAEASALARKGGCFACVMVDVDHFKFFNDTHGHRVGDEILFAVAQEMKKRTRTEDVVCRYGGEEFTILTPGIDAEAAVILAERLRSAIAGRIFAVGSLTLRLTCSFGVSDSIQGPAASLLERADQALYAAKTAGRDRVMRAAA